ncbi:hypothetical protein ABTX81_07010 [Kitasatospora sp. NPDC097605]|uniref:hypothetical protein n=1 Tax=Kitasatospora sp. NPDC097605 TaxID=3157226 RepID=UPI00331E3DFB
MKVRVAAGLAATRVQGADRLVAPKKAGCRVELLHNGESGNLGTAVRSALTGTLDLAARCQGTAPNADGTTRTIGIHSQDQRPPHRLVSRAARTGGARRGQAGWPASMPETSR